MRSNVSRLLNGRNCYNPLANHPTKGRSHEDSRHRLCDVPGFRPGAGSCVLPRNTRPGPDDQWAEFNCGNVTLSLHGGTKPPEKIARSRIALAVEDVHAVYTELKSKGARVAGEPVDYGVCQAFQVLDPDGNTVILHRRADGTYGQEPKAFERA